MADLEQQQARLFTASKFARITCQRHPEVLASLKSSGDLENSYHQTSISEALAELLQGVDSSDELNRRLRQFRRREMLRILWRDFNRLVPTLETTRDTSLLAEACVQQALDWWHRVLVEQHGEPRNRQGELQQLVVLAMGKLGARELNVSSDIDLIFCYPQAGETTDGARPLSNQEFFIKLGQRLIGALDQVTVDGFVFRVDMRLRPYGESGPLVVNFDAMEEYYEEQGRDWERYAMIKARPITGDPASTRELMRNLRPFIFRRYIDFGVIESLRGMKDMISAEVRRRGLDNDVKLGGGGIREVEFIVQCFQLIRGGRSSALRNVALLPVLHALGEEGCLPGDAVRELEAAYFFLRDVEHAIQGYEDRQTQALPQGEEARQALLAALGIESWEHFASRLEDHRNKVSAHFAELIAPPGDAAAELPAAAIWPDGIEAGALEALGFSDGESMSSALIELRDSSRLRHLQSEGRSRLDQFMPQLLRAAAEQPHSDLALLRLLPLVQAVARRSAYLALLVENPHALEELVQLCAASPWISAEVTRNPALLDELLDAGDLYAEPDRAAFAAELRQQLSRFAPDDLEANMDALRYFKASQQLHVAASEVTGRLPLMKVSDKLTFLAEVILEQALAMGWQDLVAKHGRPSREVDGELLSFGEAGIEDCGFVVIGYGKLGGIELGHGSDLDLVFVYDSDAKGATDGDRALDSSVFYTRLGQRIIHILDTRTAMGPLYEVDMRLRPEGNSGMLVAGFRGFSEYQQSTAWTWEHQALVRARVIAGDASLAERCGALRRSVLCLPRDTAELAGDVREMRAKMRDHLLPAGAEERGEFHLKQGVGGIVDIEFMVQYAVLAWSHDAPALADWSDNIRILETLSRLDLLSEDTSRALIDAYIRYRSSAHQLALQQEADVVDAEAFREEREVVSSCWTQLLGESG